jgi:hypothetical protein
MRDGVRTKLWSPWTLGPAALLALVAIFLISAPQAQAHDASSHEFTLRCNPHGDNSTNNVWADDGDGLALQTKCNSKGGADEWSAAWDTNEWKNGV